MLGRVKGFAKRRVKAALRTWARRSAPAGAAAELPPSRWRLTHDGARGLCLDGLALHELLETWGSPLHVVDAAALAHNAAAFQTPLAGSGRRCEVYYSYKTNPIPGVLRFLHDRGVGAEVISPYELWLAMRLGVPPERIVYNGPAKSEESLREAFGRGLLLVNANHREEIPVFARIARECGRRARVGVRVVAPGGWAGQFGVPIAGGQALRAFQEALASDSLEVVALHAHRGIQIRTAEELDAFVGAVLAFADELHARLGLELEILDFGGSLAIPTVTPIGARERRMNQTFLRPLAPPSPEATLSPERYATRLLKLVEAHYGARGREVPRVFVEPGRALTGNTQMLVARVLTTKEGSDGAEGADHAVLDAGMNLAEGARHEFHQLFPVNRYGEPPAQTYTLAGPICSPADVLYPAAALPALRPGDSLAIMDAGAYFVPFATSFSFPQPAIVMVQGGTATLLRRAESFDDQVALDDAYGSRPPRGTVALRLATAES